MFLVVLMESLESQLLRLITKYGDGESVWSAEEVRKKIEAAKREVLEWEETTSQGLSGKGRREWVASFKWIIGRKSKNA